jgi:hypothetical protein
MSNEFQADFASPRQVVMNICSLIVPYADGGARSIDIRDYVATLNIYEDILTHTISGDAYLYDLIGLPAQVPLIGEELIYIQFQRPEGTDYSGVFRVTKMTDVEWPNDNTVKYVLKFVTLEFAKSISMRISRPFNNLGCAEAVEQILRIDLRTSKTVQNFEPTRQVVKFTIPMWRPLKAIQFFTERALSDSGQANYMFWETLDGFHFQSVSQAIRDGLRKPAATIKFLHRNLGFRLPQGTLAAESAKMAVGFDVLNDIDQGLLRSKTIAIDIDNHTYNEYKRDYNTDYMSRVHLEDHAFYSTSHANTVDENVRLFVVTSNHLSANNRAFTSKDADIRPSYVHETIDVRNRQLLELSHRRMVITCPGYTGIRAGAVVKVELPTPRLGTDPLIPKQYDLPVRHDLYGSGHHFVVACRHKLDKVDGKFEYRVVLEVMKDSLAKGLA